MGDDPAHRQSDRGAAEQSHREGRAAGGRLERAAAGHRDRDAIDRQRGRVVQEAFALEDRHDPPRHRQPCRDRGGRDFVRRRNDRPERDGDGPRDARDHGVDDRGSRECARHDEADGQRRDHPQIGSQAA